MMNNQLRAPLGQVAFRLAITGILFVVMFFTGLLAFAPEQQINTIGGSLRITQDLTVMRDLTVSDDATVTDDLAVTDDTTLSGFFLLPRQTIAVTAAFIITPTRSYVVLTSTAEFTSSTTMPVETTGIVADTLLIIRNGNASAPINIDGIGGSLECKANIALGASDTLILTFNGTDWNCLSSYDNS